jgi:hypothetical protein
MTDPRPAPVTPLEWRLYILTALAGVYVVGALAITAPATAHEPATPAPPPEVTPIVIEVPIGWQLATPEAPTRVVRAPRARPRVRTRSS